MNSQIKNRFFQKYQLLLIIFGALVMRIIYLGLRPLDGDEGVVIKIANSPDLSSLLTNVAKDVHPPLFHLLQFIFQKILPQTEFGFRLLPALLGVGTIYFIYLFFKEISNYKTALFVSLLSIFSPILSYHSSEVRPYPLLALLFFISLYLLVKALRNNKTTDWIWYGIVSTLMLLTQYIGFIIIIAELIYVLIYWRGQIWRATQASAFSLVVFYLIWGGQFIAQVLGRVGEQSQTLNIKTNIIGLVNFIYRLGAGRLFLDLNPSPSGQIEFLKSAPLLYFIFILSFLVPLVLFTIGVKCILKGKKESKALFVVPLILILVSTFSSEIGPKLVRYYLFLAPFYAFVIVSAAEQKSKVIRELTMIFLIIYASAFVNGIYFERARPGVNKIAEYISSDTKEGGKILVKGGFGGGESYILKYYLDNPEKYEIVDFFAGYKAGNLTTLKDKKTADFIRENQDAHPLYFYDMTYEKWDLNGLKTSKTINLGIDKEGKSLMLYKF